MDPERILAGSKRRFANCVRTPNNFVRVALFIFPDVYSAIMDSLSQMNHNVNFYFYNDYFYNDDSMINIFYSILLWNM